MEPNGELLYTINTDDSGQTETVAIEAPNKSHTLDPNDAGPHYSKIYVRITAQGFEETVIHGVHIYDTSVSLLPVKLIPLSIDLDSHVINDISIPKNSVELTAERVQEGPTDYVSTQEDVVIPDYIIIHLGAPASNAQNVRARFIDYIKNAASHEVYDTWPEDALEANILCIISFTLNRIGSKWYTGRGYSFDITNNTRYDQAFVYNGDIGGNISRIVDRVFNQYIRLPGHKEPYFAAYCSDPHSECPGRLSQWGTVTLAQSGMDALRIIRDFYPADAEIAQTFNFAGISVPYPGHELDTGYDSADVGTIKSWLNRIGANFPNIPSISNTDNNVFDAQTAEAVRAFQRTFNLNASGVADKVTWYKIAQIDGAVNQLDELVNESESVDIGAVLPAVALREGARGPDVAALQFLLNYLSEFYYSIPPVIENAVFDTRTKTSVVMFQNLIGTTADGVVGPMTWQLILNAYKGIKLNVAVPQAAGPEHESSLYPGCPLKNGSGGSAVLSLQKMLNHLSEYYPQIPKLAEDGRFGNLTRSAVFTFQNIFSLTADGVADSETWSELIRQLDKVGDYNDDSGSYIFPQNGLPDANENKTELYENKPGPYESLYGSWMNPMYNENISGGAPAQTWRDTDIYSQVEDLFAYQRPYQAQTDIAESSAREQAARPAQTADAQPIQTADAQPIQTVVRAQPVLRPVQTVQTGLNRPAELTVPYGPAYPVVVDQPVPYGSAYPVAADQPVPYGPAYPVVADQPAAQTSLNTAAHGIGPTECAACAARGQAPPAVAYSGAAAVKSSGLTIPDSVFYLFLLRLLYLKRHCCY
jgi:peptidoglycan hydrolase-like protein with peptidoglycan-binding domain